MERLVHFLLSFIMNARGGKMQYATGELKTWKNSSTLPVRGGAGKDDIMDEAKRGRDAQLAHQHDRHEQVVDYSLQGTPDRARLCGAGRGGDSASGGGHGAHLPRAARWQGVVG